MSVSSFTNEVGEFNHYRFVTDELHSEKQNFHRVEQSSFRDGFSLKFPPNRDGTRGVKPYSRLVVMTTDMQSSVYTRTNPDYPDDPSGYVRPLGGPLDTDETGEALGLVQNLYDQSITEALLKLRTGRMQMGADLAEMRQTSDMMADTSRRVLNGYTAARRGRWGDIPSILGMRKGDVLSGKFAANKWLEYQYGWKPLMGTIYDGHQFLRDGFRNPAGLYFKAQSTKQGSCQDSDEYPGGVGLLQRTRSFSYKVQTGLFYKVTNSTIDTIDSAGLLNPLSVAWELVPFSFVLDWFIPVGNTLAALSATAGLEFVDGYTSIKRNRSTRLTSSAHPDDDRINVTNGGSYRSEGMRFDRQKHTSFPLPRLYANMNPFSTSHVTSALALLRQML